MSVLFSVQYKERDFTLIGLCYFSVCDPGGSYRDSEEAGGEVRRGMGSEDSHP